MSESELPGKTFWVVRCPFSGKRNARLEIAEGRNKRRLRSPYLSGPLTITDNAWVVVNHVYGHPPFRQRLQNWYLENTRHNSDEPKIDLAVLWKEYSDDVREMQDTESGSGGWGREAWGEGTWSGRDTASIDRQRVQQLLRHHGKLRHAARDRTTPPELLHELLREQDTRVRASVAANPTIPAADLRECLSDPASTVRAGAASNPRALGEALSEMASDPEVAVRVSVAENRSTSPHTLDDLSYDQAASVRAAVAGNRSTPAPSLDELSRDPASAVRKAVAHNPATPSKTLTALARDADPAVRAAAAANPSTPVEAQTELAEDREPAVRKAVSSLPFQSLGRPRTASATPTRDRRTGDMPVQGAASDSPDGMPDAVVGRLRPLPDCRRTIVTEVRVRGYPTACLRVATIPRLRRTDADIPVGEVIQALGWPAVPEEQTPDTAAAAAREYVARQTEEVARAVGIEDQAQIEALIEDHLNQPTLFIHVNPHEPRSLEWIFAGALTFVANPETLGQAVVTIGGAVVLISIGIHASPKIGSAIGAATETVADAIAKRVARRIIDPLSENRQIEKIEKHLEDELESRDG